MSRSLGGLRRRAQRLGHRDMLIPLREGARRLVGPVARRGFSLGREVPLAFRVGLGGLRTTEGRRRRGLGLCDVSPRLSSGVVDLPARAARQRSSLLGRQVRRGGLRGRAIDLPLGLLKVLGRPVWKSNFGRPFVNCICSMAWR